MESTIMSSTMFIIEHSFLVILILACISCIESTHFGDFALGLATWNGGPKGPGTGKGCGYGNDVAESPYNGWTTTGSDYLFQSGFGCGACYEMRCTKYPECSNSFITVTLTDSCPGDSCQLSHPRFDLSGKAFEALAKPGLGSALRKYKTIEIEYASAVCYYNNTNLVFKIDPISNPKYLAFAIKNVNGDGELLSVSLKQPNSTKWTRMRQAYGAVWGIHLPKGAHGPYSVKLSTDIMWLEAEVTDIIPSDWAPGRSYEAPTNVT